MVARSPLTSSLAMPLRSRRRRAAHPRRAGYRGPRRDAAPGAGRGRGPSGAPKITRRARIVFFGEQDCTIQRPRPGAASDSDHITKPSLFCARKYLFAVTIKPLPIKMCV